MIMKRGSVLRDALVLFAITLVAALLLGVTYEITKDPIAQASQKAKEDAYSKVFPGLTQTVPESGELLGMISEELKLQGVYTGSEVEEALRVIDESGSAVGYVLTVVNHGGYGGDIRIAMGIDRNGTLKSIEFLELKETAGLGMKAKEDLFKDQFNDVATDSFGFEKGGIEGETPLDGVSSATITSRAVTRAVNAGLYSAGILEDIHTQKEGNT